MPSITLDRILYEWAPLDKHARSSSVRRAKKDRQTVRQSACQSLCVCVCVWVLLLERLLWHSTDRDNLPYNGSGSANSGTILLSPRHLRLTSSLGADIPYSLWVWIICFDTHRIEVSPPHTDAEATTHEQVQGVVCGSRNCSTGNDFEMGNGTTFPIIYASLGSKQGINCKL